MKPSPVKSAQSILILTVILGIAIFSYNYFSQYKLARMLVVIFIIIFHAFWHLNHTARHHQINRHHLLEQLVFVLLTLALFSFLIYYD